MTGTFTVVPKASTIAAMGDFQALLQAVTYIHNSDNPTDGDRTVTVSVTDAGLNDTTTLTGQQTSVTVAVTINVDPVNDQPIITGLDAVTFSENSLQTAAAILDSDVTVTDVDSADFNGGNLRVSGLAPNDTVSLPVTPAAPVVGDIRRSGNDAQRYTGTAWRPSAPATAGRRNRTSSSRGTASLPASK